MGWTYGLEVSRGEKGTRGGREEGKGQLGYGVNRRRTTSGLIVLVLVLVLVLELLLYELYELYDRVYFSQLQAVRGMQPHGDPRCCSLLCWLRRGEQASPPSLGERRSELQFR